MKRSTYFGCVLVSTGSPGSADPMLEAIIQEKLKGISREASDRNDKYRKCKQMLIVSNVSAFCAKYATVL